MTNPSDDFYSRLGVAPGCSEADIRAAYRKRAKELHPDLNSSAEAAQEFTRLHEAYSTLSDSVLRARYDEGFAEKQKSNDISLEPIKCMKCGVVTAQPRYLVFRKVVSLVFTTVSSPIQGIFCVRCAGKEALKASAISAAFGWWGFPWGPIRTLQEITRNALGGFQPPGSEQRLLWYNALAFLQHGKLDLAYGLARRVRSLSEDGLAHDASELASALVSKGQKPDAPPLKNPWSGARNPFPHFLMMACVPSLFAIFIFTAGRTEGGNPVTVTAGSSSPSPVLANADIGPGPATIPVASVPTLAEPSPPPEPACTNPPVTGEILSGTPPSSDPGHILEVSNGSEGPVILKVRQSPSGRLAFSFFIAASQTANITGIPDGTYRFQYAIGTALGSDCRSLTGVKTTSAFPDEETLTTNYLNNEVGTQRLSYTLYSVPMGNVHPTSISPEAFNAD